jgi:hypothetical protein
MARGFALALVAVVCAAALAACGSDADPAAAPGRADEESTTLTDIGSVLELRAAFNEDAGSPRLLLLLSPT